MNQTVTNNNNNLIFNNQQTGADIIQSPSSPPPATTTIQQTMAATTIIPTQQMVTFNTIKLQPPSSLPVQQDEPETTATMNGTLLNTRKIIRTSPPIVTALSSSSSPTIATPPPNNLLIQTVNKKSVHNINLMQSPTTATVKPITTVNSSITQQQQQQAAASSSYLPSSSSNPSSRINLPITTLTQIQLQTTATSTPVINKITKCSQSSPSSSSSPTNSFNSVLNPSTTAKLILNGSVNGTTAITTNEPPLTLKLTTPTQQQQRPLTQTSQQQIIKTVTTNSTTQSTSLTTSIPKILLSTTPIQLNGGLTSSAPASPLPNTTASTTTTNFVLPRFLITTTTSASSNGTSTSVTNPTFSTASINIKNFGSKLNDTLNKPIVANYISNTTTTIPVQQQQHHHHHHHRATVSTHLLEAQTAAKAAEANLINFINGANRMQISQFMNQRLNIVTIPQQQHQQVITTQQPPNVIKKTRSKSDLLDQSGNNDSPSCESLDTPKTDINENVGNGNVGFEIRPIINGNKNDIIKLKTATTAGGTTTTTTTTTFNKNQSKMIVNMPMKCHNHPSIEIISSNDQQQQQQQQQSLKLQQITSIPTLQIQQSPVRDLLNPNNFQHQSAIIHIPCNLTTSSSFEAASILGTFIHHQATAAPVTNTNITTTATSTTKLNNDLDATTTTNQLSTTINGRKRHINEFDFHDKPTTANEIKEEINEQHQPAQKQLRLTDKLKTTSKKTTTTIKNVDNNNNNFENVDLNVNKCTINVLDDDTVKNLSKEFVYYDNYGIKWISKNAKPDAYTLNKYYKPPWKPKNNHFLRYSDIKIKDETKTISELTMEKEKLKGLNEWTFHYVISQIKELVSFENESLNLMNDIENILKSSSQHCFNHDNNNNNNKIYETIKANSQRHVYVTEQLNEAHLLIQNLIKNNKNKFIEILNRTPLLNTTSTTTTSGKITKNNTTQKTQKSMFNKHNIKSTTTNSNKSPIKSKLKNKD